MAYVLTRLTPKEIRKEIREIRGMEFVQLKDLVQKEWPERVGKIFVPECDGMMKKTLQNRVINMLRWDHGELKALTDKPVGHNNYKKRVLDYIEAVRPDLFKN